MTPHFPSRLLYNTWAFYCMCLFLPTVLRMTGRKITHNSEKLPRMNFWRRKPRPFLDQGKAHRLPRLILCFPLLHKSGQLKGVANHALKHHRYPTLSQPRNWGKMQPNLNIKISNIGLYFKFLLRKEKLNNS